jgi:heme exporter protein C
MVLTMGAELGAANRPGHGEAPPAAHWLARAESLAQRAEGHLPAITGLALTLLVGGIWASVAQADSTEQAITWLRLIHLPASWLSALLLSGSAFWAASGIVLQNRFCYLMMQSMIPTGGMFAFIALWSGALASKAVLGLWWIAGAREVAEVLLLAAYLMAMAAPILISDWRRADRVMAVIILLGMSQVPIAFFSVEWLQALQLKTGGAVQFATAESFSLLPLAACVAGFWCYATVVCLLRLGSIAREQNLWLDPPPTTRSRERGNQ